MSKRRRSDFSGLEDVDRSLHTSFCHAANSISQLYTQAQQQQKIAFQSGQRLGLEKLSEWIQRQHQVGLNRTTFDITNYLKNELESLMQAEMSIVQVQQQSPTASHLQQVPPPLFWRAGLPSDQVNILCHASAEIVMFSQDIGILFGRMRESPYPGLRHLAFA